MVTIPTKKKKKKKNNIAYLENLTTGLHVLYILNIHVKFRANRILFIIRFINLFLCIILD